jgi:hypothetical protein
MAMDIHHHMAMDIHHHMAMDIHHHMAMDIHHHEYTIFPNIRHHCTLLAQHYTTLSKCLLHQRRQLLYSHHHDLPIPEQHVILIQQLRL